MQRIKSILFVILTLASFSSACGAPQTQVLPTVTPTRITDTGHGITSGERPQTDADVPRLSVEKAKAAFDSGLAILVDVRHPSNYESSHIEGAISVPLIEIERDLPNVPLNQDQWIITYCT